MSRTARLAVVLACIAVARCGGQSTSPSPAPTPTSPVSPLPQQPIQTFSLSGMVKEAWIDTGLPGAAVSVAGGPSVAFATTDVNGRYTLSNLLPGMYSIRFSKPPLYGTTTYSPVSVFADATFSGGLSLTGGFPVTTASLQGYWVGQGPYPNEPCWILIIQNGTNLEGWYKDRRDYSTAMSGTYAGGAVFLRVGGTGLTIEGRVEDARCIDAVIKNEALGGNFPIAISRGASCGG